MLSDFSIVEQRATAALAAIKSAFGTDEDEYGATLFVSRHLKEIEDSFWEKHLGSSSPEPVSVLGILKLRSHWGGDNEVDTFDFTLPDNTTDYVISVTFDDGGNVADITMES